MPTVHSYDDMLRIVLERFRALLKPSPAPFMKLLPPEVDSNPLLIRVVWNMLDVVGFQDPDDCDPFIERIFMTLFTAQMPQSIIIVTFMGF
jgi:hypothetical protein